MFKEWVTNLFCMSEQKWSTIVFILFVFVGFALWKFVQIGDVPENIKTIILNCLYLIGGVNITSDITTAIKDYKNNINS